MRVFRHGEALAIVFPEEWRKKGKIREEDDYLFCEIENGVYAIVSTEVAKKRMAEKVLKEIAEMRGFRTGVENKSADKGATIQQTAITTRKIGGAGIGSGQKDKLERGSRNDELEKNGYAILENERMAESVSQEYGDKTIGTRGFDKRWFVMKKEKFTEASTAIAKFLSGKKGADLNEIAKALGRPIEEVKCTAEIMLSEGELLEKKKENYQLV